MINPDNNINYSDVNELIKDANHYGYKVSLLINGEYYHINPASIPELIKDNDNNDLPF